MASGPTFALAQDPAYLAFLRASGLQGAVATADAARRRDSINAALGINIEDLDAQGERDRRNISGSQEARGVFRSGQTLRRLSEQEEDQGRRRAALELAGAGQVGDLESNLLGTLAGSQVRGAEYGLTLSGNRALDDGLSALTTDPTLRYGAAPTTAAPAPLPAPAPSIPAATPIAPFTASPKRRTGRQQEY